MIVIAFAALVVFWLRDYWLLQLGPRKRVTSRVFVYAALVCITVILVAQAERNQNSVRLLKLIESPIFLIVVFLFHAIAAVVCFWIRSTDHYDVAWLIAMIPSPAAWVLCAEAIASPDFEIKEAIKLLVLGSIGAGWAITMTFCVLRARGIQMAFEDIDFGVKFAGWVNCFGCGLVILAISPDAFEAFSQTMHGLLR